MRLNTVTQLGDVVITLRPAISLIKAIRERLTSMIPDGYQSLSPISHILTTIIGESDQVPITEIAGSIALNEDSCKITEEADTTVEHRTYYKK